MPEKFRLMCDDNSEAVCEVAVDGRLIEIKPTGSESCPHNYRLEIRLLLRPDHQGGWMVCGGSSGFSLSDASMLSPEVTLIRLARWQYLTAAERLGLAPLCRGLVVKLVSPSSNSTTLILVVRVDGRLSGQRGTLGLATASPPTGFGGMAGEMMPAAVGEAAGLGGHPGIIQAAVTTDRDLCWLS